MGKKKKIVEEENEISKKVVNKAVSDEVINGDEETKRSKKKRKKNKTLDVENESSSLIKPKINPTISIAIPASIIGNAQSLELATRLAGQIARAATIYRIDEIVVFDNNESSLDEPLDMSSSDENESNAAFFMRILRYLETPQYLRRTLFPRHHNLRFAGLLPPLDAPHHFRKHEWGLYREGVTLGEKAPNSVGTLVDVGLSKFPSYWPRHGSDRYQMSWKFDSKMFDTTTRVRHEMRQRVEVTKNVVIDQVLGPGLRVTVAMGNDQSLSSGVLHRVVPSTTPKEEEGMYWGYKVRYAPNLSSVFENSTYENGYDYVIGTSEHGQTLKSSELCIPTFRHLLIAFGGLAGLEECIKEDNKLKGKDAREVFPTYLNLCPNQGSRTIRTEEAIFISLQYFQEPIGRALQNG